MHPLAHYARKDLLLHVQDELMEIFMGQVSDIKIDFYPDSQAIRLSVTSLVHPQRTMKNLSSPPIQPLYWSSDAILTIAKNEANKLVDALNDCDES